MDDRTTDKMWLVKHLEVTRQVVLEDLRVVKVSLGVKSWGGTRSLFAPEIHMKTVPKVGFQKYMFTSKNPKSLFSAECKQHVCVGKTQSFMAEYVQIMAVLTDFYHIC